MKPLLVFGGEVFRCGVKCEVGYCEADIVCDSTRFNLVKYPTDGLVLRCVECDEEHPLSGIINNWPEE